MSLLIIEDGTIIEDANSYITVTELNSFCSKYGLTIPSATKASTTMMEQAILRGMAFVESEYDFKGIKMEFDDPLEWPRYGVYDDQGVDLTIDDMAFYQEIPNGLKNAVCRAAYEETVSVGALQSNLTSNVKRKKIDIMETEFFANTPSKKYIVPLRVF